MINRIILTSFLLLTVTVAKSLNKPTKYSEKGFYAIKNFSPEDYKALPQNWAICQDERGVMYVGNKEGLLVYDGTNWKKIKIDNDNDIRSMDFNEDGLLYVGGIGELGYFKPNDFGDLTYFSLLNRLPKVNAEFSNVWKTHCLGGIVYFQASERIFCFNTDTVNIINTESRFHNSFVINGNLYIQEKDEGIFVLKNNDKYFLKGSEFVKDKKIFDVLAIDGRNFMCITEKHGIYKLSFNKSFNEVKFSKFKTEADNFMLNNQVYSGFRLDAERYLIGTFSGVKVINNKGDNLFDINKQSGLSDENIKFQFLNGQNQLWFGLSNGVSLIDINSPLSYFNELSNIQGTIESITRFNKHIYIATSVGVYRLAKDGSNAFVEQDNIKASETWIASTYNVNSKEVMLIEQNDKIHALANGKPKVVYEGIPWAIYQDPNVLSEFFIGTEHGVEVYSNSNNKWIQKQVLKGIDDRITDIIIDGEGALWLSSEVKGIYRLKDKTDTLPDFYTNLNGLPEGPYIFTILNNKLLIGTVEGIYNFNSQSKTFSIDTLLQKEKGIDLRYIYRMSVDYSGKLWLVTYIEEEDREEVGFFDYDVDSNFYWNPLPFLGNLKGQINAIYHDKDGVTWLGGSEGLFRYDANVNKNYKQDFHCLVRKVRLGEDSTYFYGTYYTSKGIATTVQPDALKPVLDYQYNSLIFDYSAMNIDIDNPTRYSYYLEGYDKKWSEWTIETKKEYTNLPENEYKFRVKAKNVYEHESFEGTFEFEVLPPWYRTWWAYILFALSALAVVYLIVTQYTKYLRAVIKEKTAEIVEQKEEIEKQNEEITASIKYAERIQKAVVPSHKRAEELLPEHFVLWRPRDIVSGDFWWMTEKNGLVAIVAADCTGHGVPGAFVSMLGVSFLNEIVGKMERLEADEILNQLRLHVKTTMKQTGKEGESKDGMDIGLIVLDLDNNRIEYAGAYNPLFLIRNGELLETKATRNPIGIYIKEVPFQKHVIDVQKGDTMYIFSDGFVDQFGGEKGSKFKTKNFKELLLKIQHKSMLEQEFILDRTVDEWRGEIDQVDDIIIIGLRV